MRHSSWMSFDIIFTYLAHRAPLFKKTNQTGLTCLLQNTNSSTLKIYICFEALSKFFHQTLEEEFSIQKFSGFTICVIVWSECRSSGLWRWGFFHPLSRAYPCNKFGSYFLTGNVPPQLIKGSWLCPSHGRETSLLIPLRLWLELWENEQKLMVENNGCTATAVNTEMLLH